MQPNTAHRMLRVTFSKKLPPDTLLEIHANGLSAEIPPDLRDFLKKAGCIKLSGVYNLKSDEVYTDNYGFAREFKLYLKIDSDINDSIKLLRKSHFVEDVKTISFKRLDRSD